MDRLSVTEISKGGVYEMDRRTKCQKNGNTTEMDKIFKNIFWTGTRMGDYIWYISVAFPFFGTFSVYPFHRYGLALTLTIAF